MLFFRLRGTETGAMAVDGDGVIHVVRGRNAVRRFQRLALYARHHGHRAAVSGVRADQLASTLADHPDDWRTAQEYADVSRALSQIAGRAYGKSLARLDFPAQYRDHAAGEHHVHLAR